MASFSRLYLPIVLGAVALTASPVQAEAPSDLLLTEALVIGAQIGDQACSMALSSGNVLAMPLATFEVCEEDLVGRRVALTYDTIQIAEASCEGDPECADTEEVTAVIAAVPFAAPRVATINSLTNGDRVCFVNLTDRAEQTYTQFALFEICEQDIVNKTVQLDYEFVNINAFVCQGDLECGISERALLISEANVIGKDSGGAVSFRYQ